MKYLIPLLLPLLLVSCTKTEEKKYISENYQDWEVLNWVEMDYPIPGHANHYRISYINKKGLELEILTIEGEERCLYPDGTVIVKEVFSTLDKPRAGEKPDALTAMVKEEGEWVWIVKSLPEGKEQIMEAAFCQTCHEGANEPHPYGEKNPDSIFRDYVFFHKTPQ